MAEHLASIFGTEKDRVNCPFYFKIGACRHGDRCSRLHNKPTISQTLLLTNMYQNPALSAPPGPDGLPQPVDPRASQEHFEDFYEDVFEELAQFGEIENLNVCDNLADHMVGNVYVKFRDEDAAAKALQALQGRFYAGRPILAEFSPVTDFREATCRQFEENTCARGGYCNFMHLKPIGRELRKRLFGRYRYRSRSPPRRRARSRSRSKDQEKERVRSRSRERRRMREDSSERRSKIAQWNKEREEKTHTKSNSRYGQEASHSSRANARNQYDTSYSSHSLAAYPPPHELIKQELEENEGDRYKPREVSEDYERGRRGGGKVRLKEEEKEDEYQEYQMYQEYDKDNYYRREKRGRYMVSDNYIREGDGYNQGQYNDRENEKESKVKKEEKDEEAKGYRYGGNSNR